MDYRRWGLAGGGELLGVSLEVYFGLALPVSSSLFPGYHEVYRFLFQALLLESSTLP